MSHIPAALEPVRDFRASHYYWLDWLRFLAAFLVTLQHVGQFQYVNYAEIDKQSHPLLSAVALFPTHIGREAVVLFFVLSGFLVGGRSTRRALDGSFVAFDYTIDRLTRIYVSLLPALILTGVLALCEGVHVSLSAFFGNLAGLQDVYCYPFGDNDPLYTLSYEIWFYVLWGGILISFGNPQPLVRFLAAVAVLLGFGIFTCLEPVYLFCWLLGALAFVCQSRLSQAAGLLSGLACVTVGILLSKFSGISPVVKDLWFRSFLPSHAFSLLVLSLGFCILIKHLCVWKPRSALVGALESWGTPLAAFSYTLYLIHFPLIRLLAYLFPARYAVIDFHSQLSFLLKLMVCLVGSWIFYLFFERNTARVRQWLRRRWAPPVHP